MSEMKPRILVVDDEADIRMVVGLNLGLTGMEFGEAVNGQEAIDMLNSGPWDGCILDLAMPHVDGFEVLENLKESGALQRLSVVVLSAQGSPSAAIKAMELGAHAHLTKPFSPASVAQLVQELCEMSPEDREARRLEHIDRAANLERLGVRTV